MTETNKTTPPIEENIINHAITQMSGVTMSSHQDFERELRSVLTSALLSQKQTLIREVEGRKIIPVQIPHLNLHLSGYNQALEDIINLLKK